MVVEEFQDQKIIYRLNIDEEANNILMHLSSLKTIKMILSILVYTFFSRMFDLMLPPVAKHSIVVA